MQKILEAVTILFILYNTYHLVHEIPKKGDFLSSVSTMFAVPICTEILRVLWVVHGKRLKKCRLAIAMSEDAIGYQIVMI